MRSRAGSARAAYLAARSRRLEFRSIFIDSILTELTYCVKLFPMTTHPPALWRRALAEALGTCLLVAIVVGSGIAAQQLSPDDVGLQLLQNSTATVLGLTVLILIFGPISGAHFNPAVSLVDWILGRRAGGGLSVKELCTYIASQTAGAIGGSVLSNTMFEAGTSISGKERATAGHLMAEVVATAGLILLIFSLAATKRSSLAAPAVGAYIGAAYWFTSSTSFANPAVTVGRIFSDTFAGIAPGSVPGFVLAQLIGAAVGLGLLVALFPRDARTGNDVVVPHAANNRG
jgi:glycerol uptake facilitator-like aquaporin